MGHCSYSSHVGPCTLTPLYRHFTRAPAHAFGTRACACAHACTPHSQDECARSTRENSGREHRGQTVTRRPTPAVQALVLVPPRTRASCTVCQNPGVKNRRLFADRTCEVRACAWAVCAMVAQATSQGDSSADSGRRRGRVSKKLCGLCAVLDLKQQSLSWAGDVL